MEKNTQSGFTLIELLVVISIMAIIGVFTLANYGSFGEDQKLKTAVLDIQSLLRLAQSNSTSGLKCQGQSVLDWRVVFTDTTNLDLKCRHSSGISGSLKSLALTTNIEIDSITSGTCTPTLVKYAPLFGTMTANCGSNLVTVTLRNNKISTNCTGSNLEKCKSLTIEQGGRIYGQ